VRPAVQDWRCASAAAHPRALVSDGADADSRTRPTLNYDLDDRADRARVYEQVVREGTEDDVRFYVDADQLFELWVAVFRSAGVDWLDRTPPSRRVVEQNERVNAGLDSAILTEG
jgi:hypothetical protein